MWFADDSVCGGSLKGVQKWWDKLKEDGPKYGYFPKPSKTHIIVKDPEDLEEVHQLFGVEGIKITVEGQRHVGASIGSDNFKREYVSKKVEYWVTDVENLAVIAKDEPQAAFSAFNIALSRRWSFIQRTISGISELFQPLEDVIREKFIPAIVGKHISDIERRMIALPYRHGGLGIQNPVSTADKEYATSIEVTRDLTDMIIAQDMDLTNLDQNKMKEKINKLKREKEVALKQEAGEISQILDETLRRSFESAQEKGSSSWLSALPLQRMGFILNKQEFCDAIALRYGWSIAGIPRFCACGAENNIDHTLTCKRGGYVIMRHNALRDLEGNLMREVCRDVQIEPGLLPANQEELRAQTNGAPKARLDIAARGVWSQGEKTYFDVRVTHTNALSNRGKTLDQIYRKNENEKKNLYNDRIINVEKSSFTPLVFSTSGGMAPECLKLNKRIAELLAHKRNEQYSVVMSFIRTRLRFALLKSTLISIRGYRGKQTTKEDDLGLMSFNLIPEGYAYET